MHTFLSHLYANRSPWGLISTYERNSDPRTNTSKLARLRAALQKNGYPVLDIRGQFAPSHTTTDALWVFGISLDDLAIFSLAVDQTHALHQQDRLCVRITNRGFDTTYFYTPSRITSYWPKQAIRWYFAAQHSAASAQNFELLAKIDGTWCHVLRVKKMLQSHDWQLMQEWTFVLTPAQENLL